MKENDDNFNEILCIDFTDFIEDESDRNSCLFI